MCIRLAQRCRGTLQAFLQEVVYRKRRKQPCRKKAWDFRQIQAPDEVGSGNFSAYDIYIRWRIKNTILGWKKGKWSLKYCLCFFPPLGYTQSLHFPALHLKYAFFFLTFFWKKDATIEANLWETKFARLSTLWSKTLCYKYSLFCQRYWFFSKIEKQIQVGNSSKKKWQIDVVKKKNMRNS